MSGKTDLSNLNNVYFVGIGGISMSSLALILKKSGKNVAGYDLKHSENTVLVEQNDIHIDYEIIPERANEFDTFVYTAAVGFDNAVLARAKELGKVILSRAELLGMITVEYKHSVGVAGTHGKSTTTGFIASIFESTDFDATVLAGAVIPSLNSTYKIGSGDCAVFEACEYKNSYHFMRPTIRVVLNCELDHVDFFGCIDNVVSSFEKYINTCSYGKQNVAVVNLDCKCAVRACQTAKENGVDVKYFSTEQKTHFYADNIDLTDGFALFDLHMENMENPVSIKLGVPGLHNVKNALAAAAAASLCGVPVQAIKAGLESFGGVKRRFEKIGNLCSGATLIDDYAHHPDEIVATLTAAKRIAGDSKVICIFQPHTYSRTVELLDDFASALSLCDKAVCAEIYAAREQSTTGISSKDLAQKIDGAEFFATFEEIAQYAESISKKGDLVITMGAGDVYKVFDGRVKYEPI